MRKCNKGVVKAQTGIDDGGAWVHLGIDQTTMRERGHYFEAVVPAIETFRNTNRRCKKCPEDIKNARGRIGEQRLTRKASYYLLV